MRPKDPSFQTNHPQVNLWQEKGLRFLCTYVVSLATTLVP